MRKIWQRWNLQWSVVDMTDATNVRVAVRKNTKLIWIETPSNPLISIVDLAAIASIAREAGVLTACDNTLGTPGLPSHPQHELAKTQMKDFGAMASIIIKGDKEAAFAVTTKLKIIIQATSLGGTHRTIEHRHSVEGEGTLAAPNLLRMSFGIENVEDLKEDLAQALASL